MTTAPNFGVVATGEYPNKRIELSSEGHPDKPRNNTHRTAENGPQSQGFLVTRHVSEKPPTLEC